MENDKSPETEPKQENCFYIDGEKCLLPVAIIKPETEPLSNRQQDDAADRYAGERGMEQDRRNRA